MIIKICSENQYLLDILNKNPNTDFGLYLKSLKNGTLIGNAVSPNEYEVFFQDTKKSYLPDDSNQIDFQSHCSPLLAMDMISHLFRHLFPDKDVLSDTLITWLGKTYKEVDNIPCTVSTSTIFVDSGWVRDGVFLLSRYIKGVSLNHLKGDLYVLSVSADNVREALQIFTTISLFINFTNKYSVDQYITEDFIMKYVRIMTNINGLPYFVFYLFIKRVLRSPEQFKKIKPVFEAYFNNNVSFVFTDTQNSRKDFVCSNIDLKQDVLDFGCGEMDYVKKLLKKGFKNKYFAYDKEDFSYVFNRIKDREGAGNMVWVDNINDLKFSGQIILTEVIEHNTLEEAKELLIFIRDKFAFTKLFITTPNRDFNVNYVMDEDMRHDDHKFELNKEEFMELVIDVFGNATYSGLGDCVNGIYPTSAVVVDKNWMCNI